MIKHAIFGAMLAVAAAAAPSTSFAQASYKKDIPAKLAKEAKVTEAAASATALAAVPNGKIQSVELEKEGKKFIFSYDIKVAGKTGIDEVQVDAITGKIVSNVHETPADEKKEAKADAKEKAAKAKAKKP